MNTVKFKKICKMFNRPGIENLQDFIIMETDFLTAPASTRWHNSFEGGLFKHCEDVFNVYNGFVQKYKLDVPLNSIYLTSYFHDLCKANAYIKTKEGYIWNKDQPSGHARLSIKILENFIQLSDLERNIILYHMGMYGTQNRFMEYRFDDLWKAFEDKRVKLFYFADDIAAQCLT